MPFQSNTTRSLLYCHGPCVYAHSLFRLEGFADTMGCIIDRREKTIAQTLVSIHMTEELQTQNKDQRMALVEGLWFV